MCNPGINGTLALSSHPVLDYWPWISNVGTGCILCDSGLLIRRGFRQIQWTRLTTATQYDGEKTYAYKESFTFHLYAYNDMININLGLL